MALPEIGSTPQPFTLPNQDGRPVSLADYAGKNVLLWFFPRAYGKNCTIEAGAFRDRANDFADKDTVVLGITWSAPGELKEWSRELAMTTELLSDTDHAVALAYGAADSADQERPKRVSVLIGADGRVAKAYEVNDAGAHPQRVLADLG
jgi:peroxiredoxin Q/BCP